jgi:nitroreductase
MNQVIDAIAKRRSVRSYDPRPVPRDVVETIIEAGNQAPSSGREDKETGEFIFQPWRFVVVEDPEFRRKLFETAFPIWMNAMEDMKEKHLEMYEQVMTQYKSMPEPKDMIYYRAPVILFVICPAGLEVSCALACENILIAATSLGLGSCYVGFGAMVTGSPEVVEALELKEEERILGPILLGYPQDEHGALATIRPKKKDPIVKWI